VRRHRISRVTVPLVAGAEETVSDSIR